MELQFITDFSGTKQSVIVPFLYWQQIEKELNELREIYRKTKSPKIEIKESEEETKDTLFEQIESGLKQVKAIRDGKLPKKTFKELLNEE